MNACHLNEHGLSNQVLTEGDIIWLKRSPKGVAQVDEDRAAEFARNLIVHYLLIYEKENSSRQFLVLGQLGAIHIKDTSARLIVGEEHVGTRQQKIDIVQWNRTFPREVERQKCPISKDFGTETPI